MTRRESIKILEERMNASVLGQEHIVSRLIMGLLADGNILVEGLPGLAKTRAVRAMADAIEGKFSRIQFTPDLLPVDVIGTQLLNNEDGKQKFHFHPGPIFGNIILADEINRAPAKIQSAMLEAMEERQVTVDGVTRPVPRPFLVLATQNPVELEGTFPLPEAQLDRFLLRLQIGYPDEGEEAQILLRFGKDDPLKDLKPVSKPEEVQEMQELRKQVRIEDTLLSYAVNVARATREHGEILLGASPRATLGLYQMAQAWAAIAGREFVVPDDIKLMAPYVLTHRLILAPQAQLRGREAQDLVADIVEQVPVPVED